MVVVATDAERGVVSEAVGAKFAGFTIGVRVPVINGVCLVGCAFFCTLMVARGEGVFVKGRRVCAKSSAVQQSGLLEVGLTLSEITVGRGKFGRSAAQ